MTYPFPDPPRELGHDQTDQDETHTNTPPTDVPADAERARQELAEADSEDSTE